MFFLICKKNKCKSHLTSAVLQKKMLDLRLHYVQQENQKVQLEWLDTRQMCFGLVF